MDGRFLFSVLVAVVFVGCTRAEGVRPLLLCANRQTIRKVDLATKDFVTMISDLKRSVAIDYHYEKGLIVWTDVVSEKIYSFPFSSNGSITTLVEVCVTPDGVAVDWIHDNLYWTDTGKDVIGVSRLDGSLVTTLFDRQLDEPRAIVLDPEEGLMFWTDWGRSAKIERAGMDGSQRTVIVSAGIKWPNGLAIDLVSKTIYWADGQTHVLSSASYDGTDERIIISSSSIMKHPFALDLFGDYLYWTEWSSGSESIYKANRYTGEEVTRVLEGSNWSSLMGIRVFDQSKQIPSVSRCINNGGCSHLCLPSPLRYGGGHSCACPDGVLPRDNCSTVAKAQVNTAVAVSTEETAVSTNSDERSSKTPGREYIVTGFIGDSAFLPCEVNISSCGRLYFITWYKNVSNKWKLEYVYSDGVARAKGDFLEPAKATFILNLTLARLRLNNLTVQDEGTYKCEVIYARGNCPSLTFTKLYTLSSDTEPLALGNSTHEQQNQKATAESHVPTGTIVGIIVGLAFLALVVLYMHNRFWKRNGTAKMKTQGWTGIDNPVYNKTTEESGSTDKAPV